MPQARPSTTHRSATTRVRAVIVTAAAALAVGACGNNTAAVPAPEVIAEKGTPYADLLVAEVQASITDGAIGVAVDAPVTVRAANAVLGAVSLTNEEGEPVNGQLSPDGVTWASAEPLGYNKQYTLSAEALGLSEWPAMR